MPSGIARQHIAPLVHDVIGRMPLPGQGFVDHASNLRTGHLSEHRIGPFGFERLDHQLDQLVAEATKLFRGQVERNVGKSRFFRHR